MIQRRHAYFDCGLYFFCVFCCSHGKRITVIKVEEAVDDIKEEPLDETNIISATNYKSKLTFNRYLGMSNCYAIRTHLIVHHYASPVCGIILQMASNSICFQ